MAEGDRIKLVYFGAARGKAECIRMLLNAAEANFEDVRIDHKEWFGDNSVKKEAPFGQLPYVVYKGKKLTQSVPIATYFAKKFGFYGKTDEDALRQEEVMHLAVDFSFPHFRDWFFAQDQAKVDIAEKLKTERIPRFLGYFEAMLKENGDSGFFVGDSMTLADIFMEEVVETTLSIDPEALKPFPLLQKMCSNVQSYPALQNYLANRPKSAV